MYIFAIIIVRAESETQLALLNRISSAVVSQRAVSMACLLSIGYVHVVYVCIQCRVRNVFASEVSINSQGIGFYPLCAATK